MSRTARVDPDAVRTTALGAGIVQIRLPMRGNPLRYINAYAVEDDDGLSLIDCGWKLDDVRAALDEGLAAFGATLADVRRLFVTHFHFDHYGLAGTLRAAGVPALFMHPRDWETVRELFTDPVAAERASDAWLARNGLDVAAAEDDPYRTRGDLVAPTGFLADGERYGRLRAVATPGHSPGHVCFVDTRTNRLFSGDHILDPVTPHVGLWFEDRGDPLGDYVASLHKTAALNTAGVLPAHGEPFDDVQWRIDELLAHQAHREEQILAALAGGPLSAAAIARALPWTRHATPFSALGDTHQQFAVAETLAHLEHLRVGGGVQREPATPLRDRGVIWRR